MLKDFNHALRRFRSPTSGETDLLQLLTGLHTHEYNLRFASEKRFHATARSLLTRIRLILGEVDYIHLVAHSGHTVAEIYTCRARQACHPIRRLGPDDCSTFLPGCLESHECAHRSCWQKSPNDYGSSYNRYGLARSTLGAMFWPHGCAKKNLEITVQPAWQLLPQPVKIPRSRSMQPKKAQCCRRNTKRRWQHQQQNTEHMH